MDVDVGIQFMTKVLCVWESILAGVSSEHWGQITNMQDGFDLKIQCSPCKGCEHTISAFLFLVWFTVVSACCAHPILSNLSFILLLYSLSLPVLWSLIFFYSCLYLIHPSIDVQHLLRQLLNIPRHLCGFQPPSSFGRLILGGTQQWKDTYVCREYGAQEKACGWTKACPTVSEHTASWTDAVCWTNIDKGGFQRTRMWHYRWGSHGKVPSITCPSI